MISKQVKQFDIDALQAQLAGYNNAKRYVVGYSGGVDSHVLLHALSQLKNIAPQNISAIHINHGLSSNASQWERHCQQVCDELQIPLQIIRIQANKKTASLENELREKRYQAFAEHLDKTDILLLGHHANDQAETILLRMFRGSGSKGASGMPATRSLAASKLARPLLSFNRSHLVAYAKLHNITWVEDDSNQNLIFDRNFLRHSLLPIIKLRWPAYQKVLNRFAAINEQQSRTIDYLIAPLLSGIIDPNDKSLDLTKLNKYPAEIKLNLIRGWLQQLLFPAPNYNQLQKIIIEVIGARQDASPILNLHGVEIRRYAKHLYAFKALAEHNKNAIYNWQLNEVFSLPGVGCLSASQTTGVGVATPNNTELVNICFRRGGERCTPAGRAGSRSLKKLLQEINLPPWLRDRVPLIYINNELVAVADLWVCENYAAKKGDLSWVLKWQRPSS